MAAANHLADFPDSADMQINHHRLGLAFCLALAIHAALIFGVGFAREEAARPLPKLDITLAQQRSQTAPKKADYLAQSHQQGSGTLQQKAMLTAPQQADFQAVAIQEVRQQQQQDNAMTAVQRRQEIASLEAKRHIQRQAYAKRPRVRRLTSMATAQSDDALYLHNWRSKVEAIGNQHYPSKAQQQQVFGKLRMLVSILPNGDVYQVKILQSSGHKILDQAALEIVYLAAPYAPFPKIMQGKVDVLEIIRTWHFHKNKSFYST